MKGRVGVGYKLFNDDYMGIILKPGHVVNDYAILQGKVSEFSYQAILETVEGLAIRREAFN